MVISNLDFSHNYKALFPSMSFVIHNVKVDSDFLSVYLEMDKILQTPFTVIAGTEITEL